MTVPTDVAGRYHVERRLGAGGMSTVFMATDTVLERSVAVKLLAEHLADDDAFVARFRREALAAARLQHPNIVQVFDSGQDPESRRHYIVMEYVDGPSCADLLREPKRLEIEETVRIVRDACHGLDYAHRAGVVHRDVKPGNLLIAEEMRTTKLADFGIAKAAEQTRITQVGAVLGTAAYLSPEQARGDEAGPASDTYSLGVCAYQFLTGRLPHEYASLTELALKQQQDPIVPITEYRPEVPQELDEAVRLSLERDPAARYSSALEFGHAIDAGLHALAPVGSPATWVLSNHDQTRHVTRLGRIGGSSVDPVSGTRGSAPIPSDLELGRRRARAALLLMLSLPGCVYLYQGEELGLEEVEDLPEELLQDPTWLRTGHTIRGRDGCRVPLPWSGTASPFGFGPPGSVPWLPQPASWRERTVECQTGDERSFLELYRTALRLRRAHLGFRGSGMAWLPAPVSVLRFDRPGGLETVVNLGSEPIELPAGRPILLASEPLEESTVLPPDTAVFFGLLPARGSRPERALVGGSS